MPTVLVSQRRADPFFSALLALALLALPAASQEPRLMEAGRPVEQKLKGGESHVYRIDVQKGQFLRVVLEERGIDIVLVLLGPDGKIVVEADSLNYRWGREPASMIAESSGIHQVRVESRDQNEPVGSYEIELTDLRAPAPVDQTRIAAERALFRAKKLAGNRATQSDAADAREAIAHYEKALALWREVGDRYEEGLSLYSAAFLYGRLGEQHKALDLYNEALPLCRATGDRVGEATILNNLGLVYASLGEYQKALDSFQQVLPFERAFGAHNEEATTLGNIAFIFDKLGEKKRALDTYSQILPVKRAMGDRYGEATVLLSIGNLYFSLGEDSRALDYYNHSLALWRAVGDATAESAILNNIGLVYDHLGEIKKAVDYYSQALAAERKAGNRAGEATTVNNIGLLLLAQGDKQKALEILGRALILDQSVGDRPGEALALSNMGYIHAVLGHEQEALDDCTRALTMAQRLGDPQLEASVETTLMVYWEKLGNPSLAVFFGKQAINSIQQIRRNITGLEKETQRIFLKSNESVYRELSDLLISQGRLFEAEQLLGMLKEEEYLKFTSTTRASMSSASEAVAFTKTEAAARKRYLQVTGSLTAMAEEFDKLSLEQTRTAAEDKRYEELRAQINEANEALQQFFRDVYVEFGTSRAADLEKRDLEGRSTSMETTLASLDPGTVAVYTVVAPERVSLLVVTPSARVARQYAISSEALHEKVFEFWNQLRMANKNPLPQAQELYQILIGPIQKDLDAYNATTLMWSLDDVLRYIPIAALHDGKQFMVEKYRNEVFTQKSIGTLSGERVKASWLVLGMGVSKAHGELPELPAVRDELQGIVRTEVISPKGLLPGKLLLDEAFTEEDMVKSLEMRFPIVHIASHFAFRAGDEENSFLLLGRSGEVPEADRLSLRRIRIDQAIRFRDTELLTLSACDTATSGSSNGQEVDGLADIAQEKGAKAVLASLWEVDDESTGLLMKKFYEFWTRQPATPKAEALRQAQLALLQGNVIQADSAKSQPQDKLNGSYSNPHFWAPFVLFGNWK